MPGRGRTARTRNLWFPLVPVLLAVYPVARPIDGLDGKAGAASSLAA